MKIRMSFVSNSSSSSFIIWVPKDFDYSVAAIQKLLFGDLVTIDYMYNWGNDRRVLDTATLAQWVSSEIATALESDNDKAVIEELRSLCYSEAYDARFSYDEWCKHTPKDWKNNNQVAEYRKFMDSLDELSYKHANERYERLKKENKDRRPIVISFGDDSNIGSQLEHSGILVEKLKALRVSHH